MKKNVFVCLSAFLLFCFSQCAKPVERAAQVSQGSVYPVFCNGKGMTHQMTMNTGHTGKKCSGCVKIDDNTFIHVDCQGRGNECTVSANMVLSWNNYNLAATTTDTFGLTDQKFFNMPARSLLTEDEKGQPVYLNIPAQLVYRDSTTLQFTFTGLYYSENAAYGNY